MADIKKRKGHTGNGGHSEVRVTYNYTTIKDGEKVKVQKAFYGSTLKEAEQKKEQYVQKIRKGLDVDKESVTVSEIADKWLSLKKTNMNVNNAKVKDIKKYIGDRRIIDVKRSDIQAMINEYSESTTNRGSHPGKKSIISLRYVTAEIFQMATDDRIIDYNPVTNINIEASFADNSVRPLTPDEISNVLNFSHKYQRIFIILLYTGLRRGELIPLTWGDVNWEENCISVNKTINFINNRPIIKNNIAKSKSSIRNVFLTSQFMEYLNELYNDDIIKYNKKNINNELICPAEEYKKTTDKNTGKQIYKKVNNSFVMFSETAWQHMLDNYHTDYEVEFGNPGRYSKFDPRFELTLPILNPHMFRHTFCCSMFYAGVPVNIAQRQMGHATASTTLNIYAQCRDDKITQKEIANRMNTKIAKTPEQKLLNALFGKGSYPSFLLEEK